MNFREKMRNELIRFWKEEDGFIGGLVSAGLGLASSIFGRKSAKKEVAQANQGFDYAKGNQMISEAQASGLEGLDRSGQAAGLQGALLGLGGDQAAAEAAFDQYRDSTGYKFRMNQGMEAIEGSRAARGILNSGATAKELTQFGQDFASAEFEKFNDQLSQQRQLGMAEAGQGLQAALGVASAGSQSGAAAASATARGTQNQMSGIGGLVRGVASIFGF